MIQPPFPSTIGAQPRHVTFLTTKTVVRKNQENDGQTGLRAWTSQCLRNAGVTPNQKTDKCKPEVMHSTVRHKYIFLLYAIPG